MKTRSFLLLLVLFSIISCSFPAEILSAGNLSTVGTRIEQEIDQILDEDLKIIEKDEQNPDTQIKNADFALISGEIEKARQLYQQSYEAAYSDELQAAALYGEGRTYFLERDYYAAIDAFNRILGKFPQQKIRAEANFLLGLSYEKIQESQQAVNAYKKYVEIKPGIIDDTVYKKMGDTAFFSGDYNNAIFAYQAAALANPDANTDYLNLKIGQSYAGLEDFTTAIQYFDSVYTISSDDYTRSTSNLLAGQAFLELGKYNEAYTKFLDSVIKFPKAYDSFTALTILVEDGVPVDEYLRGVVDYYAGSYEFAIQAFDRYLASNPDNNDGSVYYFKGLSYYFMGRPRNAIEQYDLLIANYPGNSYWPLAWDEKAYVQWAILGEYQNAADTLLSYVDTAPTSTEAAGYLFDAGRIFERNGDLERAAEIWQRVMDEYPSSDLSFRAITLAGISYYRLGLLDAALSIFQRSIVLATSPQEKAKAYVWSGKTHQSLGNSAEAQAAWDMGEKADPTDYYSIRSSELLNNAAPLETTDNYDFGYDLELERDEAEEWLRETFNIPVAFALDYETEEFLGNKQIQRLQAFYDLGLYLDAINLAEQLRSEYQVDIGKSYQLMNYLLSIHIYQPAIYICRDILNSVGMDDLSSLTAPIFFSHIRFGLYFRELVVQSANEFEISPLILFSLIRQESMFNPFISSSVGASGLAQIMPATGLENADLLNWPDNYDQADLMRGEVSIRLGAYYLDRMRIYLGENMHGALVAYNAGPGNAESWIAESGGDPDLLLEVIRAQETQNYIMQITEFLNIYQLLYTRLQ